MANKKLREKKLKAKERAKKEQKDKQRLFAIRKKRAEREQARLSIQSQEKMQPIRNETRLEQIKNNIEHNLEILKTLEEEYLKNQKAKEDLNKELEAEGYKTIEEKLEAIKQKSQELVLEIQEKVEGEKLDPEIADQLMPVQNVEFKNKKTK